MSTFFLRSTSKTLAQPTTTLTINLMDDKTKQNWEKVKTALEAANKTDSPIYKRACTIVLTGHDPGPGF